jgi:hypothetical protein
MDLSKVRWFVKSGRKYGVNDETLLCHLMANESGGIHRREIVVEWAKAVGRDVTSALHRAAQLGLIPTSHPPDTWKETAGTPPGTSQGKTAE